MDSAKRSRSIQLRMRRRWPRRLSLRRRFRSDGREIKLDLVCASKPGASSQFGWRLESHLLTSEQRLQGLSRSKSILAFPAFTQMLLDGEAPAVHTNVSVGISSFELKVIEPGLASVTRAFSLRFAAWRSRPKTHLAPVKFVLVNVRGRCADQPSRDSDNRQ
jgi:hypothetical protein